MNDTEAWLRDWHAMHAGATSAAMARARPSSYEWLAARVEVGQRTLDLACGDGFLLERLRARGIGELVGVDLSAVELASARARLGDGIELLEARAQALPFPDASFDCVTSHMAMMLMLPIEPAVAEILRVLKPGGRLLAVIGDHPQPPRDDAWTRLVQACVAHPLAAPPLGDPRMHTAASVCELLAGFAELEIVPIAAELSGSVEQVWSLFRLTYRYARIPAPQRAAFDASAQDILHALMRADGRVSCTLDLLGINAHK